ncbi:uncharacterized protein AB675_10378 [Cyphellophora attinorum]|uniref:Zn(2)-C6 fungal-type domain-containing protein n=1 Tax=Cyphellophora attinorum TaxID=1664694 RepID=A0A0N1HKT3_9EURO|nr:uncharacterized protein AB675_10378 [Phialophora attinorum]KPI37414.1 hypothetical protein AB675_10378 [Phialophora attinorum]
MASPSNEEEQQSAEGLPDRAVASPRKKGRGRGLRTRSGCLTCRKRHVKCDEARPACTQCTRNRKTCSYVVNREDGSRAATTEVASPVTASAPAPAPAPAPASAPASAPKSNSNGHGPEPGTVTTNLEYQSSGFSNTEVTQNMTATGASPASIDQPVGIATARWFGMLAGDAELEFRTSPQQNLPESPATVNSQLPVSVPVHVGLSDSPFTQSYRSDDLWSERLSWQSPTRLTLQDAEQQLFDVFVQRISLWLDLLDPYRNFASLVPRLALWNVGLLNAVLTLALRHESLQTTSVESPFARRDALQYYHETLHYLSKALQYPSYHTSDELLATTIIISAYEMLDGSSRDWERHLQGVFWIQRSQVIHGDSGGLRGAIWWTWLCQDVWAAFRDRRRVFTFWRPERKLAQLGPAELAARSVFILARVVDYCSAGQTAETPSGFIEKSRHAEQLSVLLDEWADLLTPQFTPLPRYASKEAVFKEIFIHPPLYGVAIQVHHAARLLILLHRPTLGGLHESLKRQAVIDGHVEQIGGIASTLTDYASGTLSSQCLYIAGLSTFNQRYRDEILRQIQLCRSRTGWQATSMEDELKFHWEQHSGF